MLIPFCLPEAYLGRPRSPNQRGLRPFRASEHFVHRDHVPAQKPRPEGIETFIPCVGLCCGRGPAQKPRPEGIETRERLPMSISFEK